MAAPSVSNVSSGTSPNAPKRHLPKTGLENNMRLDIYEPSPKTRLTNIICTIGPATQSVDSLAALMTAGLDCVRLNFSHGTHEYHTQTIKNARAAMKKANKIVPIALDTKGPEIRTGNFVNNEEIVLEAGDEVTVTTDDAWKNKGCKDCFWVDYKNLPKVMPVGGIIYVDDGLLSLKVLKKTDVDCRCLVVNSAAISNHKGVNLPNVDVDLPAISEKDKRDLLFGVEQGLDMVFASFIRKPEDIKEIRECLGAKGAHLKIISKIENHEGVRNFDEILKATDGVMVARGDLGIEVPPQKVFLAQKMMISKCNRAGKPVIVATQMLESMIKNPRPTRAEVSDVANAVMDGADCVMLSGETAKGKYPIESVTMMGKVCLEAEHACPSFEVFSNIKSAKHDLNGALSQTETICASAVMASLEHQASAIIVLTNTGATARLVSQFRPACPIICVTATKCEQAARQLKITRGCFTCFYDASDGKPSPDERVKLGLKWGISNDFLSENNGESVVCVHADAFTKGYANLVRIIQVDALSAMNGDEKANFCATT